MSEGGGNIIDLPDDVRDVKRSTLRMLLQSIKNDWDKCEEIVGKALPLMYRYLEQIEKSADEGEPIKLPRTVAIIMKIVNEHMKLTHSVAVSADKAERLDSGKPTDNVFNVTLVEGKPPEGWEVPND